MIKVHSEDCHIAVRNKAEAEVNKLHYGKMAINADIKIYLLFFRKSENLVSFFFLTLVLLISVIPLFNYLVSCVS